MGTKVSQGNGLPNDSGLAPPLQGVVRPPRFEIRGDIPEAPLVGLQAPEVGLEAMPWELAQSRARPCIHLARSQEAIDD